MTFLFLLALPLFAQSPVTPVKALPSWYAGGGGGMLISGGKFAYDSYSHLIPGLPATYLTLANEYTFRHGFMQSCVLIGPTRVLYQFGPVSLGATGLAGACNGGTALVTPTS